MGSYRLRQKDLQVPVVPVNQKAWKRAQSLTKTLLVPTWAVQRFRGLRHGKKERKALSAL